jgi:hypothetical protein
VDAEVANSMTEMQTKQAVLLRYLAVGKCSFSWEFSVGKCIFTAQQIVIDFSQI